ncbi:MAG: tetratricopeptide repeat protein [Methylacidiphilales bacterium]|nr:tetratricopeptide repeat protein [Candidatus Methylacidiphilales bacterium]
MKDQVRNDGAKLPVLPAAAVLLLAGLWIYWPALRGDWVWDDNLLVTRNLSLHSLDGLARFWSGKAGTDYWPLTSTLLWIEWHLFGSETLGYHLVSLALHLTGGLLVWRLFDRLGLRWGWFGALLFVVHPLAVESVAWISEIKNTLSLPLFLLSLLAWLDFSERGARSRYWLSVFLFLAAMLAKASVIMLPAVLLLLVWWRRGRVTARDLGNLAPYVLIALALGLVTVAFQQHFGDQTVGLGGALSRFALAGAVVFFYLGKFVLPVGLMPVYPAWVADPPPFWNLLLLPVLALALGFFWTRRQVWARHALLGFGFFLITLLPVMGFFRMAYHQISWVADHLVYLPMIGLAGLVAGGFDLAAQRLPAAFRPVIFGAATLLVLGLAWGSHAYAGKFRDGDALWSYAIELNPDSSVAHNNLGDALSDAGRLSGVKNQYEEALKLNPAYPEAHNNLGNYLVQTRHLSEAEAEFQATLRLRPGYALAHYNLGGVYQQEGRMDAAIDEFEQAVQIDPDFAEAHNNLGSAFQVEGRLDEAAREFKQALQINPGYALACENLGGILQKQGRLDDAIDQYRLALKTDPDYVRAWFDLGNALQIRGDYPAAVESYRQVLQLDPEHAEARNNLGCALLKTGQIADAIDQFRQVLQIRPGDADVQRNLARAEAMIPAASPSR